MSELEKEHAQQTEQASVPAFGYELLREILLPDILGRETASILYWAGKGIARKFPLETMEQIVLFFQEAGWGQLQLKSDKKDELEFELSSELIATRFKEFPNCHFQLEAGFLAQQLELQKSAVTECYEHPKKKQGKVLFTVKWDKKDTIL